MLIEVTSEVNPVQLDEELRVALGLVDAPGVSVRQPEPDEPGAVRVDDELDEAIVEATIAAHVAKPPPETPEAKTERETAEAVAPLADKAALIQDGSTAEKFTAAEIQKILAALVLRMGV